MSYMFEVCNNLAELDLSSFHTSPVDNLQRYVPKLLWFKES